MTKAARPTKGVRPQMEGVPGVLVEQAPEGVLFGRREKSSPYDPLLLQLRSAGHGKFLKFEGLRAKPSVYARAKKLGIKVLFGEQGDTLWVTLAKVEMASNGVTDPEPAKPTNAELVVKAIEAKRFTAGEIVSWMRSNGAAGIGISQVDSLLLNLTRAGKLKLKPQKPGDDQPERWILA